MQTSAYDYDLPPTSIAQTPAAIRDQSRLLDSRDLSDHLFSDLSTLLRPMDLVVVNRSRVRCARLTGQKVETGGAVEVLLLRRLDDVRWEALVRPARRLRKGSVVELGDISCELLTEPNQGVALVALATDGDIENAIERHGQVPLPPYIHRELEDPDRYQTIFAGPVGSAAAPTAGLHFTEALVAKLTANGMRLAEVELEVGLDTFRPIAAAMVEDHVIHRERYSVPDATTDAIRTTKTEGGRVVAVGTTVVRALESAAADGVATGETSLYLRPGSPFAVVDVLVTNFHAPRTSLLVLLDAFMGDDWRPTYETAMARGYRFLSFGDAMLAEKHR